MPATLTPPDSKSVMEAIGSTLGLLKTPLGTLIILVASLFANYKIMGKTISDDSARITRLEQKQDTVQTKDDAKADKQDIRDGMNQILKAVQETNRRIDQLFSNGNGNARRAN